jgi:hypothetical protein
MTKKLIVDISDEMDEEFRKALIETFGFKKGVIKKAVEEAIQAWIKESKNRRSKK